MLLQPLKILFVFSRFLIVKSGKSDLISLVSKFLEYQKEPINIDSYLCNWNNRDLSDFSKVLWSEKYRLKLATNFDFPHKFYAEEHQLFLVDLECSHSEKVLKMADENGLFKLPYRWFIFGEIDEIVSKNLNLGVDSKFFVITERNGSFLINALFKFHENSTEFTQNEIGEWNISQNSFTNYNYFTIGRNRTNLHGTILKVSYVLTNLDSLKHLWDYRDKHVDTISKLNFLLINYAIDFMNATGEFMLQRTWGYKNKSTSLYDGMVGDLQRGIAEIGGTASFFTQDRVAVVDFVASTYKTFMRFIFRKPPLSYVSNIFALPFDTYVWYSFLGILILTCASLYLVAKWESKDEDFDSNNGLKPSVGDVVLLEISAIAQQGSPVETRSIAGRIATVFVFISVIFLYTSYSASIVVLLQSTTDSIRTLDDLLNSRISLGVEDIVYAHYYFKTATEPTRKALYEQKIAPKNQKSNFMTVREGIQRLQNEFFGFHIELSTGYKAISDTFKENEKCGLSEIAFVNIIEPWINVRKHSNYKELLKIGMKRLHEHGMQKREGLRIYTKKPKCNIGHGNFGSVGLTDCYFAFVLFGFGILCGFFLLFSEILFSGYLKRKAMKKLAFIRVNQ